MSKTLRVLPAARMDTVSCFEYLRAQSGAAQAWHFIASLQESFDRIQQMPFIGAVRQFRRARLRNIRQWPVREFEDYLIFYRVTQERIDIQRILHSRRNLEAIFARRD